MIHSATLKNKIIHIRIFLDKILIYSIPLLVFFIPLSRSLSLKVIDVIIPIWILSFRYKEFIHIAKTNKIFQAVLLLTIIIFLSYLWSSYDASTHVHRRYSDISKYFNYYFKYFLFPLILISTKLKKENIPLILNIFLFAMFINELISYGIVFELWSTPYGTPSDPVPFQSNHITYSAFVGFTILISIYKFFHIKNKNLKIFYLIFLTTMSINLFMSAGRTGQFSLFITSILLIIIYFRKDMKSIFLSLFLLLSIFITAYSYMDTFKKRVDQAVNNVKSIQNKEQKETSFGTRILAIDTIPYLMNTNNILFGVGMGDKITYISKTLSKDYPYKLHNFNHFGALHSSHVEMLVSNGLVGLALYLSIFYFLFFIKIKDKFIKYLAMITSIYMLCYGMVMDIFYLKEPMLLFALFIAVAIVQYTSEQKEFAQNYTNKS